MPPRSWGLEPGLQQTIFFDALQPPLTDSGDVVRVDVVELKLLSQAPETASTTGRSARGKGGSDLGDPPAIPPVAIERGFRDAQARGSLRRTAESLQSVHDEALSEWRGSPRRS